MPPEKAISRWFRVIVAVGTALISVGLVWAVVLLVWTTDTDTPVLSGQRETPTQVPVEVPIEPAVEATSESRLPATVEPNLDMTPGLLTLSAPVIYDGDLGTGSAEFSSVTLNELTNRLMIADDEGQLFEFDVADDGSLVVPPRRSIQVEVGDSDIEGIGWVNGTTYVMAHEADGVLSVVEIADDQLVINSQDRVRIIRTGIVASDGNGIEGVTIGVSPGTAFVVAVERPPSLHFIGEAGVIQRVVPLQIGLADVSDVWAAPDGTIWIVSDENAVLVRLDIGADGTVAQRQQVDLVFGAGRFPQAEGVVMSRDSTRLYAVGEGSAPGEFTVAFWSIGPG